MQTAFRVLIDADVIASHTERDIALRLARRGMFVVGTSEFVLAEARNTLLGRRNCSPELADEILSCVRDVCRPEMVSSTAIAVIEKSMTNDSKDRHVLAAAVLMRADRILTRNDNDFGMAALFPFHIEAVRSDRLFSSALAIDKGGVAQTLLDETRDMPGRERTIDMVLDQLKDAGCGKFAADARAVLESLGHI